MRSTPLLAAAAAVAAAIAPPALLGAQVATTLRIEGAAQTVLPETPVPLEADPAATVVVKDALDADTITVPAASATAQLGSAATQFGFPISFSVSQFGSFVGTIGPDTMPASFSPFWRLKVDGKATDTGADTTVLAAGASVTWAFVSDFDARELDLAVSGDRLAQGAAFQATVVARDNAGAAIPAAGALVRYGDQQALAGSAGTASFTAGGEGVRRVSATRAGDVRSPVRAVCSFAANPAVCDLPVPPPPAPGPAPPGPAGASGAAGPAGPVALGAADTTSPGSRIGFPEAGRTYSRVTGLRGVAGPDRSDVARVEVALAQRVGTQCRFRAARGGTTPPRRCADQLFVPARAVGGNWLMSLGRGLAPGVWRVWSRAVDGAGNREAIGIAGTNTFQFRVGAPAPGR